MTERLNFGIERKKPSTDYAEISVESVDDLDRIADGALEILPVVSTEGELFAVLHDDAVLAVKPRLHLFDPIDLHDG